MTKSTVEMTQTIQHFMGKSFFSRFPDKRQVQYFEKRGTNNELIVKNYNPNSYIEKEIREDGVKSKMAESNILVDNAAEFNLKYFLMKKQIIIILGGLLSVFSLNAQDMKNPQSGKKQFGNTIVIEAPISKVWDVLIDSKQMEIWGPPVQKVELITNDKVGQEKVGSIRKVDVNFGKTSGYFMEKRIYQEELQRLDYQIFEETTGLFKVLKNVGFSIEVEEKDANKTLLIFSFYQHPNGIFGWLMHPLVKNNQKKVNTEGLESLKQYIEKL